MLKIPQKRQDYEGNIGRAGWKIKLSSQSTGRNTYTQHDLFHQNYNKPQDVQEALHHHRISLGQYWQAHK